MVFVNLIDTGRLEKPGLRAAIAVHRTGLIAAIFVLVAAALIAGWAVMLERRSRLLDAALARAETDRRVLESSAAISAELERRDAMRQRRLGLIDELRRRPSINRAVLDELASATPPDVWLLEFVQKGSDAALRGAAPTFDRLSELVLALESSPHFRGPVEVLQTEIARDGPRGPVVTFSLKATVNP